MLPAEGHSPPPYPPLAVPDSVQSFAAHDPASWSRREAEEHLAWLSGIAPERGRLLLDYLKLDPNQPTATLMRALSDQVARLLPHPYFHSAREGRTTSRQEPFLTPEGEALATDASLLLATRLLAEFPDRLWWDVGRGPPSRSGYNLAVVDGFTRTDGGFPPRQAGLATAWGALRGQEKDWAFHYERLARLAASVPFERNAFEAAEDEATGGGEGAPGGPSIPYPLLRLPEGLRHLDTANPAAWKKGEAAAFRAWIIGVAPARAAALLAYLGVERQGSGAATLRLVSSVLTRVLLEGEGGRMDTVGLSLRWPGGRRVRYRPSGRLVPTALGLTLVTEAALLAGVLLVEEQPERFSWGGSVLPLVECTPAWARKRKLPAWEQPKLAPLELVPQLVAEMVTEAADPRLLEGAYEEMLSGTTSTLVDH